jgi:hypothetical protein
MKEAENVAFVKQCYDAYGRGDVGHLMACMAPQIEWELPEVPGVPFTGKRHGSEQVAEYFQLSGERQTVREFTPKEFVAQGDKVVVLGHGAWQVKETGAEFQSDWVHVFTIRDGQIAAFREFLDSNVAAEAFGCGPAAMRGEAAPGPAAPIN